MQDLSPIVLFTYNRIEHTRNTIEALLKNKLAVHSDLFIYSDGAKKEEDKEAVLQVREYLKSISGFRKVTLIYQASNKGLAASIIEGVTKVINTYGKVIVLEDDIITSPKFLNFMNESLRIYEKTQKVWHINGYNYPISHSGHTQSYFWRFMTCWGWATWKDRWQCFEKDTEKLMLTFTNKEIYKFNVNGNENFWHQIELNNNKVINTWAIYWYATIFKHNGLCLTPLNTFTKNIGFDGSGVHCTDKSRFNMKSELSSQDIDILHTEIKENLEMVSYLEQLFNPSKIGTVYAIDRVLETSSHTKLDTNTINISINNLEKFIQEKQEAKYRFISLDELEETLTYSNHSEKNIVLTFNQGYKEILTNAFPLLKKYNIPFTIYLSTSFPDSHCIFWWDILEELIINNTSICLENKTYSTKSFIQKNECFNLLKKKIFEFRQENILKELNTLFSIYKIDWLKYSKDTALSWDDILTLSKSDLCTIGFSNQYREPLNNLSEEAILTDILKSKSTIEKRINKPVYHFTYPYGTRDTVSTREFNCISELNLRTCTTMREGNIEIRHNKKMNVLPRIPLTNEELY